MGKDRDQKQLDKLTETPEEKKRRRQEKKERKEAKRSKQDDDLMGYTNESNPFGDSNLTEKFVWKLKKEKEEKLGIKGDKYDGQRKDEIRKEIEKVKKRREEREAEKAQWEEEKARLQREADASSFKDWESKEDEFYLKQAKMAAEIRIKQGRAKPIDILYKNLSMDSDFDFEMNEPYKIFKGLELSELEELKKDIKTYLELDTHKEFWQALSTVCDDELETARKNDALMKSKTKSDMMRFAGNTGMHEAITDDVHDLFKGKTSKELDELQSTITMQIESGAAIDVEYWETLLKKLAVFRAKAKLKEIHADMLRKKLAELESMQAQQSMESGNASPPTTTTSTSKPAEKKEPEKREPAKKEPAKKEPAKKEPAKKSEWEEDERKEKKGKEEDRKGKEREREEEKGGLSPALIHTVYEGEEVVEPEKDMESLSNHRKQVLTSEAKKLLIRMDARDRRDNRLMTDDEMYRQEAERGMEESEEMLGLDMELPVENKVYSLHDKFRPRKPKFFNRVHTGYEWNKYNQTHYDHDNPPPKVVQGYKFNIFYPDLLDKSQAPTYKVLQGPTPDTCTLLIHAGPPYEDVAFKIVNREWEYSHKKGFRCTFERGILHLWFNFKRYRYRR